jgi:hypothetical protein
MLGIELLDKLEEVQSANFFPSLLRMNTCKYVQMHPRVISGFGTLCSRAFQLLFFRLCPSLTSHPVLLSYANISSMKSRVKTDLQCMQCLEGVLRSSMRTASLGMIC